MSLWISFLTVSIYQGSYILYVVNISTIGITRDTRELLKTLGKKGDTYDMLIRQLVNIMIENNKDSLDGRFASLQSSESRST
jgi:hypothetical protein